MKKIVLILAVIVSFIAVPLAAQDMKPPKPLDSGMMKWLVGKWEGTMNGPMGAMKEWDGYEMDLGGQFLFMTAKAKAGDKVVYEGMGAMTTDPKSGDTIGYWIDNFRGLYKGKGKEDMNKIAMKWTGGGMEMKRILEKMGPDKMKVTEKMKGPDGKMGTSTGEFTRMKKDM
ncbi:MAG: DUF1579 domain-containing protein [bacterium]|nr:DUF1579 domain-containing protein [bacterium]